MNMKKLGPVALSLTALLLATPLYAQDMQSVSFDEYLKYVRL